MAHYEPPNLDLRCLQIHQFFISALLKFLNSITVIPEEWLMMKTKKSTANGAIYTHSPILELNFNINSLKPC